MENAKLLHDRVAVCNAPSPFRQDDTYTAPLRQSEGGERVGQGRHSRESAMSLLRKEVEVTYALFQRAEAMGDLSASAQYVDRCYEAMGELRRLHAEVNEGGRS